MALGIFAECRPPGIYKQDYINELFKRYSDPANPIAQAPPRPDWEEEDEVSAATASYEEEDEADEAEEEEGALVNGKKRSMDDRGERKQKRTRRDRETIKLNPVFAEPNLPGVVGCTDLEEIHDVQSRAQRLCDWKG